MSNKQPRYIKICYRVCRVGKTHHKYLFSVHILSIVLPTINLIRWAIGNKINGYIFHIFAPIAHPINYSLTLPSGIIAPFKIAPIKFALLISARINVAFVKFALVKSVLAK